VAEDEGTDVSAQPERDRGPGVGAGDDRGPWDLLVVGGGTAGLVAARTARSLGARVLLVERERMGGDCLWTGCVPSKSLLAAAHAAAAARGGARLGVHAGDVVVDFAQVMAHVHGAQREIAPVDSAAALERAGVRVRSGQVRLTGPGTATVDGRPVTFRSALLATGSAPVVPPLPGLADVHPLTSDSVWELDALPVRLAVLGGGSIGCELGQAFARLGAGVTLVEAEDLLLGKEDPRAAALLRRALEDDGVQVRTGSAVRRVTPGQEPGSGTLHLADGGEVEFDRLLVSVGRAPAPTGSAWRRPGSTSTTAATSSSTSTCAPPTRGYGRPATSPAGRPSRTPPPSTAAPPAATPSSGCAAPPPATSRRSPTPTRRSRRSASRWPTRRAAPT